MLLRRIANRSSNELDRIRISKMSSFFSADRIREKDTFPRWKAILPSVASHLCIGAPYAWSLFVGPLQVSEERKKNKQKKT